MTRLTLASQSPSRLELLRNAGYDVDAVPARIAEPDLEAFTDLESGLIHVATLKARAAAKGGASGLILGCDTVGVSASRVFGKPADRAHARRMLEAISGTVHQVLTGWCLLRTRDELHVCGVESTTITMRAWTSAEFDAYLEGGEWIGKSGAYGLQWPHDPFVTQIEGSASNVIGVPLERLAEVIALM
ncbi:MAG: septum formation protein Maf [Planctomycetia bacterium]|nr:septum formation protein Maf [Planctomycetia bacterium]